MNLNFLAVAFWVFCGLVAWLISEDIKVVLWTISAVLGISILLTMMDM